MPTKCKSSSLRFISLFLLVHQALATSVPPSSPRKSLNFGPIYLNNDSRVSIFDDPLNTGSNSKSVLIDFNTLSSATLSPLRDDAESLKQFGIEIASRFLHRRHSPTISFELTSAHHSKHTGVLHAYFVQTIPISGESHGFLKVHNAVANFNIDLDPQSKRFAHILSYGDSFHPVDELPPEMHLDHFQLLTNLKSSRCASLKLLFNQVLERAVSSSNPPATDPLLQQNVFGQFTRISSPAPGTQTKTYLSDFTQEELVLIAECEVDESDQSGSAADKYQIVDPRVALVSFLTLAGDANLDHHLRALSLDELVHSIYVVNRPNPKPEFADVSHSETETVLELYNVPGALPASDFTTGHSTEPTFAELAWLSVDVNAQDNEPALKRELRMVWRFEYRSHANWYEAYVHATQPGLVPMVVDWVKDFRPTNEIAPTYFDHLAMQADVATRFGGPLSRVLGSRRRHHSVYGNEHPLPPLENGSTDTARPATYRVLPWSVNDPTEAGRKTVKSPHDTMASPLGWHTIPSILKTGNHKDISQLPEGWSRLIARHGLRAVDTRGNNVFAQENWEGLDHWQANYRPNGTEKLEFVFPLGWNQTDGNGPHVEPKRYIDAAVSELFYTCNEFHDLTYRYGFDEEAGNFQEFNFGRGGKGGDAVIANAQDGSGYNNANFATPPDGQHGQMRMYVWNGPEPWRDGDLEAGIVIHEYAHGVSTRLTGGPANSGCLGWGEAGGMGEGWGDTFATLVRMHKAEPTDFTMGEWASGVKGGIRKYKYSLNTTINPENYETLDKPGYWGVHAIGEVWAEMLFTMAEELIAKHGFESSLFPPASFSDNADFYKVSPLNGKLVPKRGNTLFFQLVLDGMKLQPCRPGFFDARDSILEADEILTGGENRCEIWRAFASRGLGIKATLKGSTPWGGGIRKNDFQVPVGVCRGG